MRSSVIDPGHAASLSATTSQKMVLFAIYVRLWDLQLHELAHMPAYSPHLRGRTVTGNT